MRWAVGRPGQNVRTFWGTREPDVWAENFMETGEIFVRVSDDAMNGVMPMSSGGIDADPIDLEPPLPPETGMPLEAMKGLKRSQIDQKRDAMFTSGFSPADGPLAGQVLQTRTVEDRTNWLTSQAAYLAAVLAGHGAAEEAVFRTQSNATFTLSYEEGYAVLLTMAAWGKVVMNNSWTLKDLVAAATDQGALDAIDIEAGWPS